MADYVCKHCKYNNNGWCVARRINGLKKIYECNKFKRGKYGDFESSSLSDYSNDELIAELRRRLEVK